jgi:hypothetical protein
VGFDSIHHFRTTFKENLRLALAVYRDARLEVTERGVDLYPSRPPIAPRIVGSGRVPGSTRGKNTTSDSGRVLAQQPPRAQVTEEIGLDHIVSIARRQR